MPQTSTQRRASDAVAAWLAEHEKNQTWLKEVAGIDLGTVGSFLRGETWPKLGVQGKIEKALGWPSGSIRQIGNGAKPEDVGAFVQDPGYVAAPGDLEEQSVTNEQVLSELRAIRGDLRGIQDMREDLNALSRRVARLESGAEPLGGLDGPV